MTKFVPLLLCALCGPCAAQTPANNLMPDGSHDMYVGLGGIDRPIYEGAVQRRKFFLPALQIQWSSGLFVAGQSLGLHLSQRPDIEYGPLLGYDAGRTASGAQQFLADFKLQGLEVPTIRIAIMRIEDLPPDSPLRNMPPTDAAPTAAPPAPPVASAPSSFSVNLAQPIQGRRNRVLGMQGISPRILKGGFVNYYLNSNLRLTNNVLYGSGNDRHGVRWSIDLQQCMPEFAHRHAVSVSIGLTAVNRAYNLSTFGVTQGESYTSGNKPYAPGGGIKDVHSGVFWNWAINSAWLLSSGVSASELTAGAASSPLVERRFNLGMSSFLAYRY